MSRYRRADVPGGSYFFTVVTERRQPILTAPALRAALRESIETVRATRPFRIDGWVLLPDHLHAILTLPEGDADYATRWRLIKAGVTRRCGALYGDARYLTARRAAKGCGTLWQHRYWEHLLRDERDFRQPGRRTSDRRHGLGLMCCSEMLRRGFWHCPAGYACG